MTYDLHVVTPEPNAVRGNHYHTRDEFTTKPDPSTPVTVKKEMLIQRLLVKGVLMNLLVSFINLDVVSGTHYSFASRLPQ